MGFLMIVAIDHPRYALIFFVLAFIGSFAAIGYHHAKELESREKTFDSILESFRSDMIGKPGRGSNED